MLEPHAPHAAVHTAKDFLIHIAAIAVGLLLAIGLEQSVEWLHHRHQLHQLETDLNTEGIRNLHVALDNIRGSEQRRQTDADQYAEFVAAARDHRAPLALPAPQTVSYTKPAYAVWTVAQQSGTLGLLPREDAQRYARLYSVAQTAVDHVEAIQAAGARRSVAMLPAMTDPSALHTLLETAQPLHFDLSLLNPEDLREARDAVGDDLATARLGINRNVYLYGIEWSVLHGSRSDEENVRTLYDAMDVYLHGGTAALLAKYPLPE
jgi:hypothetical protein